MLPELKFALSQKLDYEIAWSFYQNPKRGGVDFWQERVFGIHKQLGNIDLAVNNKEYFLNKFVKGYYKKNRLILQNRKRCIERLYAGKSKKFFEITKEIFKNHPWPKGKYICFVSIFDFSPRFLEDKTFQVYAFSTKKTVLFTIFHEMTHFIFYDYAIKKYPKIFQTLDANKGLFWDLGEIFNSTMHRSDLFFKLHGEINDPYYPEHRKYLKALSKLWLKDPDIDSWLLHALELLKNKKVLLTRRK